MNYWDSVGRWINTLLVFIVGVLAFDTLFRLLDANDDNVLVGFVQQFAVIFLVPFQGMFGEQDYVLTTLIGVLGYSLLAGIALSVLRALQASAAHPARPVDTEATPMVDAHDPPPEALPLHTQPEAPPAVDTAHPRDDATADGRPSVATDGQQTTPVTDGQADGRPARGERANGRAPRPTTPDTARERRRSGGEPATSTDTPATPADQPAPPTTQPRTRGGGPRDRGRVRERSSSRRSATRRADVRDPS